MECDRIREHADHLGVDVTEVQCSLLLRHLGWVIEANRSLNLTAITDASRALLLHVVDSLAVVPHIPHTDSRWADIGSGAGYPGIPLAVVCQRPVDLIESVRKKAAFLRQCVNRLDGLSGSVVHALRAEEVAQSFPREYGVVTARALTSLPSLVELASPLLAPGGHLIAMKGVPAATELESGSEAARIVGMRLVLEHRYELPESGESRMLLRYEKVGEPEVSLPRRTGIAQKRPLA